MTLEGEDGFRVVDRRASASSGPDEKPAESNATKSSGENANPGATAAGSSSGSRDELPAIDFSTFVFSLSTSVMHHLGFVADPQGGAPERNLPLARQTIDILEMLQQKTRGNLEPEEARLIESLLYELRMRFVEASR